MGPPSFPECVGKPAKAPHAHASARTLKQRTSTWRIQQRSPFLLGLSLEREMQAKLLALSLLDILLSPGTLHK